MPTYINNTANSIFVGMREVKPRETIQTHTYYPQSALTKLSESPNWTPSDFSGDYSGDQGADSGKIDVDPSYNEFYFTISVVSGAVRIVFNEVLSLGEIVLAGNGKVYTFIPRLADNFRVVYLSNGTRAAVNIKKLA